MSRPLSRRRFIGRAAAAAALALSPVGRLAAQVSFSSYPFKLGVSSGDPAPDGFVLWTRLAPEPLEPQQLGQVSFELDWEVAEDAAFTRVAANGRTLAMPHLAHSAHVEVVGLAPGREYFYRFRLGRYESPVGRALTLPAAGAAVASLRYALASCAQLEQGFFAAYRYMADERPDLIVVKTTFWERPWGYSDHCIGIWGCIEAFTEARPAIIEKHIKMVEDCVDAEHSVFPNVFKSMVQEIREDGSSQNHGTWFPLDGGGLLRTLEDLQSDMERILEMARTSMQDSESNSDVMYLLGATAVSIAIIRSTVITAESLLGTAQGLVRLASSSHTQH